MTAPEKKVIDSAIRNLEAFKVAKDKERGMCQLTPAQKGVYETLEHLKALAEN